MYPIFLGYYVAEAQYQLSVNSLLHLFLCIVMLNLVFSFKQPMVLDASSHCNNLHLLVCGFHSHSMFYFSWQVLMLQSMMEEQRGVHYLPASAPERSSAKKQELAAKAVE